MEHKAIASRVSRVKSAAGSMQSWGPNLGKMNQKSVLRAHTMPKSKHYRSHLRTNWEMMSIMSSYML